MKKIIVLVLLFLGSLNNCFSQNPNSTKTIKIYDTDTASILRIYKSKLPQQGYRNLYIQLTGVNQGNYIDSRYGNIYRLNYQTGVFGDTYHNSILHNSFDIILPYGLCVGYSYDFNISPMDTNLIIEGGCSASWEPSEGILFTLNNGGTVSAVFTNVSQAAFITVAIDPTNDSIMYAGLRSFTNPANFYKTTNRGANWFATDTITNYTKSRTYVNPMNHNTIFLMNSNLYRSTTGGYDFTSNITGTSYEGKMLFDETENAIYLISPTTEGIRKSTNNGDSWVQIFNKPSNDMEIDPLDNNIFYVGTGEGIYISTNKGTSWTLYNNTFSSSKNVIGIVKNPNTADTLYAVTNKAVYKVFGTAIMDTVSAKYFPLAVGNVFVYNWIYNGYPSTGGIFKIKILKDTIISGVKYYKTNGNFPAIYGSTYLYRYDSVSGNIYNFIGSGGCGYNYKERLIDSLEAKINDTAKTCNGFDRKCYDTSSITVFSITTPSKKFDNLIILSGNERKYGKDFGIVKASDGDPYLTEYSLNGCVINGTVYGDTTVPSNVYSISGSVRYSDNNQPATNGYVKAFKLDRNTGNILILDSAMIQTDGSYSLTHVPQDSVDIGIYPNSITQNDWVITYYPSTTYWQTATALYPTGNLTNINIGAIRMSAATASNSVNGKVMRLTDDPLGNLKDAFLYAKNGNTFVRCVMSDGNGVYHLNSLPTGNLKIIVNRLGFTSDSVMVNVTSTSNIDSINFYLNRVYSGIKQVYDVVPSEYKLYQNYPNPFNPSTIIKYSVPNIQYIKLNVYDILGKEIATLVSEKQSPGVYEVTFDASQYPSGVYFYKLETQSYKETKRMILIK